MSDKTVRVGLENTSFVPVSPATSTAQTDGTQKTQIVDGSGNVATVTGNKLDVNATISLPATQDVNLTKVGGASIAIGQQLAAASLPVILPAATITTLTPPAAITGFSTEATLKAVAGFVILPYDYVIVGYTGNNATSAIYKTGGSGGTTVATLAMTYDGSNNLLTVTKT